MRFSEYTIKEKKEVLDILNSSENGISNKEAERRLKIYGFNEIKEREVSLFDVFSRQFKSPFFYWSFAFIKSYYFD